MQGVQLTFYTQQQRMVHGHPLADWLLEQVRHLGIRGATLIAGDAGFGHAARLRAAHSPDAAGDQPVEVTMALMPDDIDRVFALLKRHDVNVFYVITPIEFGLSAERV